MAGKKMLAAFMALWLLAARAGSLAQARRVIPGGQLVGVTVKSDGLIYVGASDLGTTPSPARLAGLKSGDVITRLNGEAVTDAESFIRKVGEGKRLRLGVMRGETALSVDVEPEKDERDGRFRIGAWVRDHAAGVGTLTYIDPQTGEYGALGHAIEDPDTGMILPIQTGTLYESAVTKVVRGEKGEPGQLAGDFMERNTPVGDVKYNYGAGIGGVYVKADTGSDAFPNGIEVSDEVKTGMAQILSTVEGEAPRAYDIRILRVDPSGDTRNLMLEVTDPTLLKITGGIVQGMSGSPIIQNGKLVGAVTHVLVDDPTRGYGILIRNMLKNSQTTQRAA